jgi:hypothetical protein
MPPVVAAGLDRNGVAHATVDDHVAQRRHPAGRLIGDGLQGNQPAPARHPVSGEEQARFPIRQAVGDGTGAEAGKERKHDPTDLGYG